MNDEGGMSSERYRARIAIADGELSEVCGVLYRLSKTNAAILIEG